MMTRCTRCLMPSSYPDITFNEDGICNHCLEFKKPEPKGEEVLLQKIHSRYGEQFDCLVGISGGKDSCYVAYLAKRIFGLRVLAVSYEFPFMVELAKENTRAVCQNLGIELLVVRSKNNLEYDLVRNHLTSLAPTGTTWGQCMFCHYGIEAILFEAARSRGIPFILSGVTNNETWWNPGNRLNLLFKQLKKLDLVELINFGVFQSKAYLNLVDQRRQFPIPGNSRFKVYSRAKTPPSAPEIVKVYDYIEWNQKLIETTLQAETGWKKPAKSLSWRYDCILEPLLDFTFKRDLGISSAGLFLCGLIRSGGISREEALNHLEEIENQSHLDQSLRKVLDFLEISKSTQEKFFKPSEVRN